MTRPERLDQVQVQTAKRVVTITWAEREALLARLNPGAGVRRARRGRKPPDPPEAHREIAAAFVAVGVSRPVELTAGQRRELLSVLDSWEGPPHGLRELHVALAEE